VEPLLDGVGFNMIRPNELPLVITCLTRFKFKSTAVAEYNKVLTEKPAGIIYQVRKTQQRATPAQEEILLSSDKGTAQSLKTYMEICKIKDAWPKAEPVLAKDPEVAVWYALQTQKPFKGGEASIATNARYSFVYARDVLHGRFQAGEPAIQQKKNSPNGKAILWEAYCKEFGVQ
jgi:hypothetical protein